MRRPDSDVDDRDLDPANQDPDWDLDKEPEVSEPTDPPPTEVEDEPERKQCSCCGTWKPLSGFSPSRRYRLGVSAFCRKCHQVATVKWQKANPERLRAYQRARYAAADRIMLNAARRENYDYGRARRQTLMYRYKVTPQWYAATLDAQSGACAICLRPATGFTRALGVDHDHACCNKTPACGRCNRGLLCGDCNAALHSVERDGDWLARAGAYVTQFQGGAR